ncbi:MAG TPA: VWA domain-containing protein [Blastocatellia bacterium]|nr:VWA domain-containing protein [Blastocatellia bacterium]
MNVLKVSVAVVLLVALNAAVSPSHGSAANKQTKQDGKPPAPPSQTGQDDQTIKLGAALVTVPFSASDKHNAYINDLTKDDIEILEDNKPQTVFSFEHRNDLPLTIAMLIDISGSENGTLPLEKNAGSRFFAKVLRPSKDLGAIVTFESEAVLVQDLTGDANKLERAMGTIRPAVVDASVGGVTGTPPIVDSQAGSTSLYDAVYSVSGDLLRREAGRRVIILITDGNDTSSQLKLRDAIQAAWRNEIEVYSIGIGDPGFGGIDRGTLKKIADETGGRAYFPRGLADLDAAFAQIDIDLRQQYIASYQPSNEAKDGSFRTILLRVKNRKDLTLRFRRGYFAPKAES